MLVTDRLRVQIASTRRRMLDDVVRDAVARRRERRAAPREATSRRTSLDRARPPRPRCHRRRALLFVNGDVEAAIERSTRDGVHLPAAMAPSPRRVRDRIGDDECSSRRRAHSVDEATRRRRDGADLLSSGTVFATHSQAGVSDDRARMASETLRPPCRHPGHRHRRHHRRERAPCIDAGAAGVAVIGAISSPRSPRPPPQLRSLSRRSDRG